MGGRKQRVSSFYGDPRPDGDPPRPVAAEVAVCDNLAQRCRLCSGLLWLQ